MPHRYASLRNPPSLSGIKYVAFCLSFPILVSINHPRCGILSTKQAYKLPSCAHCCQGQADQDLGPLWHWPSQSCESSGLFFSLSGSTWRLFSLLLPFAVDIDMKNQSIYFDFSEEGEQQEESTGKLARLFGRCRSVYFSIQARGISSLLSPLGVSGYLTPLLSIHQSVHVLLFGKSFLCISAILMGNDEISV